MSNEPIKVLVDTVLKLERRSAQKPLQRILEGTHPADLARLLRYLPDHQRARIFGRIPDRETRAEVLSEVAEDVLASFLNELSDDELAGLLEEMDGDDTVDVLELVDEDRKARLLGLMTHEEMNEAEELLRYNPESAGGIMSPDFFALTEDTTSAHAIEVLQRKGSELEMAFYLYVINAHGHLVGVLSLRQLVISPPTTPLAIIMEPDVVRVQTGDDQEIVARIVARYNLLALPVVDETNKLVGIVTVDDVIDVIREEATEDMLKMVGAGEEVSLGLSAGDVAASTRSRLPWLFASWIGGVAASFIIHGFEDQLAKVALLAAFIPVIIGMGGNVGTQSLTIVTRGLALGQIVVDQIMGVVLRELLVGLACGVIYGLLLGVVGGLLVGLGEVLAFGNPLTFGLTIGASLCAAMVIAAIVGSAVPMLFQRLSIDPAVATGPFVTTAVDVLGILAYFGAARVLMGI